MVIKVQIAVQSFPGETAGKGKIDWHDIENVLLLNIGILIGTSSILIGGLIFKH